MFLTACAFTWEKIPEHIKHSTATPGRTYNRAASVAGDKVLCSPGTFLICHEEPVCCMSNLGCVGHISIKEFCTTLLYIVSVNFDLWGFIHAQHFSWLLDLGPPQHVDSLLFKLLRCRFADMGLSPALTVKQMASPWVHGRHDWEVFRSCGSKTNPNHHPTNSMLIWHLAFPEGSTVYCLICTITWEGCHAVEISHGNSS